jgi:methyltransferase
MEGRYYVREADRVVDELKTIREPYVMLVDDEAFINGNRMAELARVIGASGIRKRYFTYCRIDSLVRNRAAVALWKEIGLERLFVGIDAITATLLETYNKHCTVEQIEEGLAVGRDLDMQLFCQFVVPTTFGRRDFVQLKRFIEHYRIEYPSFTVLTPIPGTSLLRPDFSNVTHLQPNGRPDWDLFDTDNPVTRTTLPREEFIAQYEGLWEYFSGAYTRYVDRRPPASRSVLVNEVPASMG